MSKQIKFQKKIMTGDEESQFQTIKKMQYVIEKQNEIINKLKKENKFLNQIITDENSNLSHVKSEIECLIKALKDNNENYAGYKQIDLCQKRILLVGGMEKMENFYKEMVNKLGGKFKYHDGKCYQSNQSNLKELVQWSDMVLCPVDVNSHSACMMVKRECRKSGKQYYMLRKSSLSTFYKTLASVSSR